MTAGRKLVLSILVTAGLFVIVRQGNRALKPALPSDMPVDAAFVQSGLDIQRSEPTGDWVACRSNANDNTDFCRVTDQHGTVIYEGAFLPLGRRDALSNAQLKPATTESVKSMWVQGPAESAPVPVIPLVNGAILVPAADADALADRWARNPDELARLGSE